MVKLTRNEEKVIEKYHGNLPFAQIQRNLDKILTDYGITEETRKEWINDIDVYSFLGKDGKSISEYGKRIFEHFKDCIGNEFGETTINMAITC